MEFFYQKREKIFNVSFRGRKRDPGEESRKDNR